jgi:hypothetical protein
VKNAISKGRPLIAASSRQQIRESVRGMESSAMLDRARHQTSLPFTRDLAGPADYTTMLFTERRRDSSVAHQIATLAVFASTLVRDEAPDGSTVRVESAVHAQKDSIALERRPCGGVLGRFAPAVNGRR